MLFRLKSGETPNSKFSLRYATKRPSLFFSHHYLSRLPLHPQPLTVNSSNTNTRMVVSSSLLTPDAATPSNHTMTISIFSYNGNLMLAAAISLLLVILFVLLLHIYAKWFLLRARRRRIRRRQASSLTGFLRGFHHFQTFSSFDAAPSSCSTKGLDPSLIASIPIFLYKRNLDGDRDDEPVRQDLGLECVICLSDFEDDDIGRALANCGHAFHAECIDMWLHSHTTCPICRSPAAAVESLSHEIGEMQQGEWERVIDVGEDNNNNNNNSSSSRDRVEEEEEASVVMMALFIVSLSVSRGGSARWLAEENA